MTLENLTVRALGADDAPAVAGLLALQSEDYLRFFYALGGSAEAIAQVIEACERDVYAGIFWQGSLICVFMLRGWDSGFDIPTFGLIVAAEHRGKHVVSVAVEASKLIGRFAGARRMMIKVHPQNEAGTIAARRLGFVADHEEAETGNIVSYMEL